VAVGLLSAQPAALLRQEVTLRYRFTKGDTARYRVTQQSTTVISGLPGGMPEITIGQTIVQTLRTVAKDVAADGTATVEYAIESVKMDMNTPMSTWSFDTATQEAPADPMAAATKSMMAAMIGEPFTIVQTNTGAVKSIEGFARIAEKVFKQVPDDPMSAGMVQGLKAMLSDEGMRNTMGQTFAQLPERPLKVGDSWKSNLSFRNPMIGVLSTTILSTLKSVEGTGDKQQAIVVTQLTTKPDPSVPPQANPMGLTIKMGDSTGDGEVVFDVAGGKLQRAITRATAPLVMSGSGPDGTPMNMTSNVKTTVTAERIQ
jgi:Family of unknown function (DUF6263)